MFSSLEDITRYLKRGNQVYSINAFQTMVEVDEGEITPPLQLATPPLFQDPDMESSYLAHAEEYPAYLTLPRGTITKFYYDVVNTDNGKTHRYHFLDDRQRYFLAYRATRTDLERLISSQYPALVAEGIQDMIAGPYLLTREGKIARPVITPFEPVKAHLVYFAIEDNIMSISPQVKNCLYGFSEQGTVYYIRPNFITRFVPTVALEGEYAGEEFPLEVGTEKYLVHRLGLSPCVAAVSNFGYDVLLSLDGSIKICSWDHTLSSLSIIKLAGKVTKLVSIDLFGFLAQTQNGIIHLVVRNPAPGKEFLSWELPWGKGWEILP